MLTYRYALRTAMRETWAALVLPAVWQRMRLGLLALAFLLARLALLLTAPVSIPLMAWATLADHRLTAQRTAEARARLRKGIHQNGPAK